MGGRAAAAAAAAAVVACKTKLTPPEAPELPEAPAPVAAAVPADPKELRTFPVALVMVARVIRAVAVARVIRAAPGIQVLPQPRFAELSRVALGVIVETRAALVMAAAAEAAAGNYLLNFLRAALADVAVEAPEVVVVATPVDMAVPAGPAVEAPEVPVFIAQRWVVLGAAAVEAAAARVLPAVPAALERRLAPPLLTP
jgi:hypothetical protein